MKVSAGNKYVTLNLTTLLLVDMYDFFLNAYLTWQFRLWFAPFFFSQYRHIWTEICFFCGLLLVLAYSVPSVVSQLSILLSGHSDFVFSQFLAPVTFSGPIFVSWQFPFSTGLLLEFLRCSCLWCPVQYKCNNQQKNSFEWFSKRSILFY